MTTKPERSNLCQRCGLRPVAEEPTSFAKAAGLEALCESCFEDEMRNRLEGAFRQWGGELETALRNAGTPLPDGTSGYDFAKAAMEESQRLAQTPEARARFTVMKRIAEEVAAELPGGTEHPDFGERLMARMRPWLESQEAPDDEASA